jgi:hypothetical protein
MLSVKPGKVDIMPTITSNDGILRIGKDFVDAACKALLCPKSKGEIRINNGQVFKWYSRYTIKYTETLLRRSVKNEGARITYFKSQTV